jgi:hypothetical protein
MSGTHGFFVGAYMVDCLGLFLPLICIDFLELAYIGDGGPLSAE